MTDIEQKALALLNEVAVERGYNIATPADRRTHYLLEVACRAIEQHEAFRQEVSDAVGSYIHDPQSITGPATMQHLSRFIIAKPDPLVEVLEDIRSGKLGYAGETCAQAANNIRTAIEKRGGRIVWGEG